jgi:hypothetical protein
MTRKFLRRWFYSSVVKTVPAAKFKAQCLALLDRVDPDGILITKHGKPVTKLDKTWNMLKHDVEDALEASRP